MLPGTQVCTFEEFVTVLRDVASGEDAFKATRRQLVQNFFEKPTAQASSALFDALCGKTRS
jgi:hypothetical protein